MTGIYFKLAGMGCYGSENIINLSHVRDLRDTCCKCIVWFGRYFKKIFNVRIRSFYPAGRFIFKVNEKALHLGRDLSGTLSNILDGTFCENS